MSENQKKNPADANNVNQADEEKVEVERLHVESSDKAGRGLFGNSGIFDANRKNDVVQGAESTLINCRTGEIVGYT